MLCIKNYAGGKEGELENMYKACIEQGRLYTQATQKWKQESTLDIKDTNKET